MIKNILKVIWNQKRKNAFIMVEMFLLFLLLFASGYYFIDKLTDYWYPENYTPENRIFVRMNVMNVDPLEYRQLQTGIAERLAQVAGVKMVAIASDGPLVSSYTSSSINVNDKELNVQYRGGDENLQKVLGLKMVEGRWFTNTEVNAYSKTYPFDDFKMYEAIDKSNGALVFDKISLPVVIDRLLADKIQRKGSIIGHNFIANHRKCEVVGVVEPVKRSPFERAEPCIFFPVQMTTVGGFFAEYYLLTKDKVGSSFYQDIRRSVYSVADKSKVELDILTQMEALRARTVARDRVDIILIAWLIIFVLFTVLLGLVGILTYNINRRKAEMGILRAVGSTQRALRWRLILEMVFVSLMGVIPAVIVLAQLPMIGNYPPKFYYSSLALMLGFLVLLVMVFVWYPGYTASQIQPARALKDE